MLNRSRRQLHLRIAIRVRVYLFETGYAMANGMCAARVLNSEQQVLEHRAEDQ
jgi:hypothetical protein